jgi:hypothetical protein
MKKSKDRYDRVVGKISSFYHNCARKKEQHCYHMVSQILRDEGFAHLEIMYQNLYGAKSRGRIDLWSRTNEVKPSDLFDIAEVVKRLYVKGFICAVDFSLYQH